MGWTNEQITQFQMDNNQFLAEVNATLKPDPNLNGKVGIFVAGQAGDLMTCMSVLKYRDKIFPGKELIWYVNMPNADCLRYAPISEVRPWPWAGNGLPENCPDYFPLLCNEHNRLNVELAKQYPGTADLEDGYFPAPHQLSVEKRHGIDYPNVSKKVFGVPSDWEWHPYLSFAPHEYNGTKDFIDQFGVSRKIFIETFAGSGQSILDQEMVMQILNVCRNQWPECVFIFGSHKFLRQKEEFPEGLFSAIDVFSVNDLTVRQCAIVAHWSDLMISVSSGITVASSAWGIDQPPTLQFCGSEICSTKALANGPFTLVTADGRTPENAKEEFFAQLSTLLNQYK